MATISPSSVGLGSFNVPSHSILHSAARPENPVQPTHTVSQARTKVSNSSLLAPIEHHIDHRFASSFCPTIRCVQQTTRLFRTNGPRKLLVRCLSVARTSEASTEAEASYHVLPGGEQLEVLEKKAKKTAGAPIVFIHGSYHAAWCWEMHWMGYFAEQGHDTYAISLLGQGNSTVVDGPVGGTIFSHAENIADVIRARVGERPVLVGHSFGGLVVQAYLAGAASAGDAARVFPPLAGAALLCSVPPTGNSEMVKRITMRTPIAAMKLTWSLAAKGFSKNLPLCRDSFFSSDMPDADVARYQKLLAGSSKQPLIDLRAVSRDLPVKKPPEGDPPVLVMAAADDFVVDKEGGEETAAFYGTEAIVIPKIAHDVMLDVRWKDAAEYLLNWLGERGL
ncbi:hypothetical protein KFL_000360130 [Klebsormidium nitens]|uniref:AB hydrolase-1 domain-containing protein n=1 Tax=Klebsormidium nitens TaxID=105231 RepID=A0A1Y1HT19_KLENI|nr:hypothetical protein KFL_000360130 [Klebsormidium nitens]|eukprot:GAQ79697.1 hypothetical protein KFL_000360130 [Klebsormidium nitens]